MQYVLILFIIKILNEIPDDEISTLRLKRVRIRTAILNDITSLKNIDFFLVILQYSICSDIYVIFRDSPINKYFVWSQRSICTPKFKSKKKKNDNKNHTQTHICTCVWIMSRQKLNIKKKTLVKNNYCMCFRYYSGLRTKYMLIITYTIKLSCRSLWFGIHPMDVLFMQTLASGAKWKGIENCLHYSSML